LRNAGIQADKVLRELDDLWAKLVRSTPEAADAAVMRACSMTLLVVSEEDDSKDASRVSETLAELMRDHPSRAIILRLVRAAKSSPEARVFTQCWMPFGKREQVCCEHVEISFCAGSLHEVSPLAAALVAPDLPVVLWCRATGLLTSPDFDPVLRLAQKVIVDSAGVADLESQLRLLLSIRNGGRIVADLAWTRLTRWREAIAKVFDNPVHAQNLGNIDTATMDWDGDQLPMSACYFAAWLAECLPVMPAFTFRRLEAAPRPRLHAIGLSGQGIAVALSVNQDRLVDLHAGRQESHTVFPALSDYELLSEELSLLGRDSVYERLLPAIPKFLRLAASENA